MQKSVRLFVLVAVLSLTAAPQLRAERMGTNPHPQIAALSAVQIFTYTVLSYLGV